MSRAAGIARQWSSAVRAAPLGDITKVAQSGVTTYLRSWRNSGGPPHDFLVGDTLEIGESEDPATAPAVKGLLQRDCVVDHVLYPYMNWQDTHIVEAKFRV